MSLNLIASFNTSKLNLFEYALLFGKYLSSLADIDSVYTHATIDLDSGVTQLDFSNLENTFPQIILTSQIEYKSDITFENPDPKDYNVYLTTYSPTGFYHSVEFPLNSGDLIRLSLSTTYDGSKSKITAQWPDSFDRSILIRSMAAIVQQTKAETAVVGGNEFWDYLQDNSDIPYLQVGWLSYIKSTLALEEGIEVVAELDNGGAIVAISKDIPKAGDKAALSRLQSLYKHVSQAKP